MRERSFGFSIALIVFALDQLMKWVVAGPLHLREVMQITILPIFNLTWTENNGISLGLLNAETATGRSPMPMTYAPVPASARAKFRWVGGNAGSTNTTFMPGPYWDRPSGGRRRMEGWARIARMTRIKRARLSAGG